METRVALADGPGGPGGPLDPGPGGPGGPGGFLFERGEVAAEGDEVDGVNKILVD